MLLPVVIVLVLSLLHVDVKKTIAISGLVGMVIAVFGTALSGFGTSCFMFFGIFAF